MNRQITTLISVLSALALISCGGDDNKVNTDSNIITTTNPTTGTIAGTSYSSQESSLFNNMKKQVPCNSQRRNDVAFHMPRQQSDATKICGQASNGARSGNRGQIFFGVSGYGDIMMVTEIISGSQVIGHNITLSMCSQYMNYYGQQVPLIGNERTLTDFRSDKCMVLDKETTCPYGFVDYASQTYMISGPLQLQGFQTSPVPIYTSFTRPNVQCNSSGTGY